MCVSDFLVAMEEAVGQTKVVCVSMGIGGGDGKEDKRGGGRGRSMEGESRVVAGVGVRESETCRMEA